MPEEQPFGGTGPRSRGRLPNERVGAESVTGVGKSWDRVEERLEGDSEGLVISLKNGSRIGSNRGRTLLRHLERLLDSSPENFRALLGVARDETQLLSAEVEERLVRGGYLRADRATIHPDLRNVLLSAYRETPDGPLLVSPFQFENQEQVDELERQDGEFWRRMIRELRSGNDRDPPPDRS